MSAIWSAILNALISLIKTPLAFVLGFFAGKRAGRKDVESEQLRNSLDAIADAEDARRNVKHDPDSVHDDPFNRDNA